MTIIDPYKTSARGRAGGPANLSVVTPSDTETLSHVCQWVYVGQSGALHVTTAGGQTLVTPVMNQGWHLMELRQVHATGTTATGIMVGW